MAEELGERTEKPTGRKLGRARSEGNVAKSTDLSAAIDLSGAFLAMILLGPGLIAGLTAIMRSLLDPASFGEPDSLTSMELILRFTGARAALLVLPFFGLVFLASFLGQFFQVGWLWTFKPIQPKLHKLNPLQGVRRLASKTTIMKMAVNVVKLTVVGAVAFAVCSRNVPKLAALPALDVIPALAVIGGIIIELLKWVLAILLIIGLLDYFYQKWHRIEKLKMTKQEVKEEVKQMEGDLQAKARRLNMARNMLYQQMAQGVKTADVVVTNPTHFAVALKYDSKKMNAPTVVAKGGDYMALRIRQLAREAGVPIVEKPPLARALYHNVDVGRAIAPEFYQAVAEILAYVYRLKGKVA